MKLVQYRELHQSVFAGLGAYITHNAIYPLSETICHITCSFLWIQKIIYSTFSTHIQQYSFVLDVPFNQGLISLL